MTPPVFPLAGVVGAPVAHSRSPALHKHWLAMYRLAGDYVPLEVAGEDLGDLLRALPRAGFVGLNVTVPHKERVLALADIVSERAVTIGAANTLVFRPDGKVHADNTDVFGFLENLRRGVPDWRPEAGPAAVVGAGGAARAVIAGLLDAGVPRIRLTNRSADRADALAAEFGDRVAVVDWARAGEALSDAATVVNASSLGMTGKPAFEVPLDALDPAAVVTDLVYAPLRTDLLAAAEARGCRTVDGLGMLLYQAVPAFEAWFGIQPEVTEDVRAQVIGR